MRSKYLVYCPAVKKCGMVEEIVNSILYIILDVYLGGSTTTIYWKHVRCVTLVHAHQRCCFLWCQKHKNEQISYGGKIFFTDKSKCGVANDSECMHIRIERNMQQFLLRNRKRPVWK
ncbi:hypothetical protein TNIN_338901 [Trichonephila inaurata madagascariensis]|uniref:Uncharacterized protein n=1 Tax=Trichonephila inaurata madagascariensis TaxID=2747483 RepID=A0A8X6M5V1_9ARAC|nr:hypothetical protein TNIN_338901 [Trichonephila inaurata madagascariensis]